MTPHFNLLDEPWLPVRLADGEVRELGLLALFEQADRITALADTAPPNLVAQYRLLLAITHRALTSAQGSWKDGDRARWYREGLPLEALRAYLNKWRERFWLFHPEHPFMQVATLDTIAETRDKLKPWAQISLASATGNSPVMFDHSWDQLPQAIAPGMALRTLLGFLQFTPGGLVKTLRVSDKAGPLSNTAAIVPLGANLSQTLCLALHPAGSGSDLPSWERPALQRHDLLAPPALATGSNDRYTRLSRAVLLQRTDQAQVKWLRFAAGLALGDDPSAPDPMASYRAGKDRLIRLTFTEGRAFWRDLPTLVPDAEGKSCQPASVLGWAATLHALTDMANRTQPLLLAGIASAPTKQAKLLRWRCEQIALPSVLLRDARLAGFLRNKLRQAETLHTHIRTLATGMLAETMADAGSKDTRARAWSTLDAGASTAVFFATMERALPKLLQLVGAGDGDAAESHWSTSLVHAAGACWDVLTRQLGRSASALRAEARGWPRFQGLLRELRQTGSNTPTSTEEQA